MEFLQNSKDRSSEAQKFPHQTEHRQRLIAHATAATAPNEVSESSDSLSTSLIHFHLGSHVIMRLAKPKWVVPAYPMNCCCLDLLATLPKNSNNDSTAATNFLHLLLFNLFKLFPPSPVERPSSSTCCGPCSPCPNHETPGWSGPWRPSASGASPSNLRWPPESRTSSRRCPSPGADSTKAGAPWVGQNGVYALL